MRMNSKPIPAMVAEDEEEKNWSSDDEVKKQFDSLQRVITISYDNLNRLRHETASTFVREEIKTLEGKLVRLFYRQMALHEGVLEPHMDLWLRVVGLTEPTIEGLLDRKMKLGDSVEHIESVKAAMKQLKASDEDVRRLCIALHNIRIYKERCQSCESGKQAQWQDLHWENWSTSTKNHGSSISSSGTINSSYFHCPDSGFSFRHSSEGTGATAHRPNVQSYSETPPYRHMSDGGVPPSCLYRRRSTDSGGCAIAPWESDGGYSTPSSPSFLEGHLSYSNLSIHSVVNSRHKSSSLQRSNTVSLVTPLCSQSSQPVFARAKPLRASVHSLPIRKPRKWNFKKGKRVSRQETISSRTHSVRSSVDYDRNPHSIEVYGFDSRVKAHSVHHQKSIVPKICCLCRRSMFYGVKCGDCGARYHEACYYQAGASFRAVHPEQNSRREPWLLRLFRRTSTETHLPGLSTSSDSGLGVSGNEKHPSISSLSGYRSGGSSASTPGGNSQGHGHFFPNASHSVDMHTNAAGHLKGKRPEAKVAHVNANGSLSLPCQWNTEADSSTHHSSCLCRHSSVISDVPEETSTTTSRAQLPNALSLMSTSSTLAGSAPQSEVHTHGFDSTASTISDTRSSLQSTFNDETTTLYGSEMSANADLVSSSGSDTGGSRRFRCLRGSLVTEWEIRMEEINMSDQLPQGKFGRVFRGNWHGECAVRLFQKDDASHDNVVAFRKEVQLMKKTRHENIALFMAAVVRPPDLALVTAFIKGKSLHQLIHMEGERLAAEATRPIAKQITQGMAYLHTRGIVHRDLRSRNVFIDATGHIVISDFAMSSILLGCCDRKQVKLRHDKYGLELRRGVVQSLAPELIKQLNPSDAHLSGLTFNQSTDVFAFATVIYECMQGWPVVNENIHTLIYIFGNCLHVDCVGSIVSEFKDMILRAWSPNAEDRLNFTYYEELIGRFPRKLHQMSRVPSYPMVCMEANF
ncbi:kinase suppressor of Ras 1-like isoform X2 [Sycon ciliatum]|uniref:kinase suppressor of Ras 1-like isoform X2 n=1 Tax=Sycon ciliatum TaxID=27933 RepID=UPI0020AA7191